MTTTSALDSRGDGGDHRPPPADATSVLVEQAANPC